MRTMVAGRKRAIQIGLLDGPLTAGRYGLIRTYLYGQGYGDELDWAESLRCPDDPDLFALEAVWVIVNSGMKAQVATGIFRFIRPLLEEDMLISGSGAFGHKGKCAAIDWVWANRKSLHAQFLALKTDPERLAFCETLPWIGPITKWHLAKNWGVDVAKPDRHLVRLAEQHGTDTDELCWCLAAIDGVLVRMVDSTLWRACNLKIIGVRDGAFFHDPVALPEWETTPPIPDWLVPEFEGYRQELRDGTGVPPASRGTL
jgi:hypothetical protein